MEKEKGHPQAAQNTHSNHKDNSVHSQRSRLLEKLRECNLTTSDARHDLDIMHPAARVQELREMGFEILTVKTNEKTSNGGIRHLARYVLVQGVSHE
jgi:hypothetical protein